MYLNDSKVTQILDTSDTFSSSYVFEVSEVIRVLVKVCKQVELRSERSL